MKNDVILPFYMAYPYPYAYDEQMKRMQDLEYLQQLYPKEAKNILIERNLRLVAHVCKKYNTTNIELDDLISIGTIGLIKGINSFDSSKGVRLATYVSRCVDNAHLTLRNYMTYFKRH